MSYRVAIVGATGAVGKEMLKVLDERNFPIKELTLLASARSAGKKVTFRGQELTVQELVEDSFAGIEIALFSAGGSISKKFAPIAAAASAIVVDNTSAFRMDPSVPLVVPEVNPEQITQQGIIANPNCSTIQMVVALHPILKVAGIKRVVVSTYQAVAGAGQRAIEEFGQQIKSFAEGKPIAKPEIFPHQILFECLPQIGSFLENGNTVEEEKMIHETRKIFELPKLAVTATTVRVPVMVGHSESVNVETMLPLSADDARRLLADTAGIEVVDQPDQGLYPLANNCVGKNPVYVGRIREDHSVENGLNLWVVADNLRKGAALNAVQIAEIWANRNP